MRPAGVNGGTTLILMSGNMVVRSFDSSVRAGRLGSALLLPRGGRPVQSGLSADDLVGVGHRDPAHGVRGPVRDLDPHVVVGGAGAHPVPDQPPVGAAAALTARRPGEV